MLRNRYTYKNCKIIVLYAVLAELGGLLTVFMLIDCYYLSGLNIQSIVLALIGIVIFLVFQSLAWAKNNNYKIKYLFSFKEYKKQVKNYLANANPCADEKGRIRSLKDSFRQFGEVDVIKVIFSGSPWDEWIGDQLAFNYGNALFEQKLSFLTYELYEACASGSGFEKFFLALSYEPFTDEEIKNTLFFDGFYSSALKKLITSVLAKKSKVKEEELDDLFAKFHENEDKELFTFEEELADKCSLLAENQEMFSGNFFEYYYKKCGIKVDKLYYSKNYKKRAYIYHNEEGAPYHFMVQEFERINCEGYWQPICNGYNSYVDSVENALKEIEPFIKNFIEKV